MRSGDGGGPERRGERGCKKRKRERRGHVCVCVIRVIRGACKGCVQGVREGVHLWTRQHTTVHEELFQPHG